MADSKTATIQIPKWTQEISASPKRYAQGLFKSLAFLKMKEYEKQIQPFENKYKIPFEKFEKKAKNQNK